MKHSIRTLLTIAVILFLFSCGLTVNASYETSGKCGDNVTWELDGTTLYVRGTGAMWDTTGEWDNYTINSWEYAIYRSAKKVVISEGITHIGKHAFSVIGYHVAEDYSVEEIILPSSLATIGESAFVGCTGLQSISIPNGVTELPTNAFASCYNLKQVNLPNSLTSIGSYAFSYCENLQTIHIPDSVTSIGSSAFSNCRSLTSISLSNTLASIGDYAFNGCHSLTSLTIPGSVTSFGSALFVDESYYYSGNNTTLKALTFGEGITEIPSHALICLSALTTLNLPDSLVTLKGFNNTAITELDIPDSVTMLSGFNNTAITKLDIPNSVTDLSGFDNTAITKLDIPDSVTTLGGFNNTKIANLNIPNSVTNLSGFNNTLISKLDIPDSVTMLSGFQGCNVLTELNIPVSVISIGSNAFSDCSSLKKITIPNSVASIDNVAFANLPEDTEINFLCGNQKEWNVLMANHPLLNRKVNFTHDWQTIDTVDPTCTKDGNTAGKVCKLCEFGDPKPEVIPAIGHAFDPYEGSCTNCGEPDPAFVSNPFTDVAETDWFYKPVLWAKMNNVTGGTSPTTFSPDMGCTRAQVVTFLWAANGKPDPMSMYNPFTDVSDEAWYVKPVLWAVENGITGGTSATTFSPDATCTRAQIVTFLYAAQGKPNVDTENNPFTDVADTDWYVKPVLWAAENNVTGGIGNNQFGPNNTCTRGQVVTFLFKVYENK